MMKYIVKSVDTYQKAIDLAWAFASRKGEKEILLTLEGNSLKVTSMGGGSILHTTVEVVGVEDGSTWVDGAQLEKVSSLLPVGRELSVTLGQALTYQVQGYSAQDIPLAATHPKIPDLGTSKELFTGVDLGDLQCNGKALATFSLKDYAVVLNTNASGALMRVLIQTAYACPHPFSTEVNAHILTFMRKMRSATISYYPKGYMGLVDGDMELLVPITTAPNDGGAFDMVEKLATMYCIKVQQQDLLSALNWSALSTPTAVSLSYTDPQPYIEIRASGSNKAPTKVAFTQGEGDVDDASMEEAPLQMEEGKYAPTSLLMALGALPKGTITLTGKQLPANGSEPPMSVLLLTHQGASTIDVLLSALA